MLGVLAVACAALSGCGGGEADEAAAGTGGESGPPAATTYALDYDERCGGSEAADLKACPGTSALVIDRPELDLPRGTVVESDGWTIEFVGSHELRTEGVDSMNDLSIRAYVVFEFTNRAEEAEYFRDAFDVVVNSGDRYLDSCSTLPRDGRIDPGESVAVRYCFGNNGPSSFYEKPLSVALKGDDSIRFLGDAPFPDGTYDRVIASVEKHSDDADADVDELRDELERIAAASDGSAGDDSSPTTTTRRSTESADEETFEDDSPVSTGNSPFPEEDEVNGGRSDPIPLPPPPSTTSLTGRTR